MCKMDVRMGIVSPNIFLTLSCFVSQLILLIAQLKLEKYFFEKHNIYQTKMHKTIIMTKIVDTKSQLIIDIKSLVTSYNPAMFSLRPQNIF